MNCPECNTKSVGYLAVGNKTHGYCPIHDKWFPDLVGAWSPWDADWHKHTELHKTETIKDRLEKSLQGEGPFPA
jgi:hypothetical protein